MRKFLRVLGVLIVLSSIAYAAGFKAFSWNAMLFGTGSGLRSIQFDKTPDGNTAIIQVDPTDEYFNFNNLSKFNGSFQAISTTIPSRPCPAMTEVQRDAIATPADGDCVYNTDANQLNTYNATAALWVAAGSGGGGGLDVFYEETFELTKIGDITCGNNATFLGAGAVVGTPSINSTTPIAGDNDFKFVQTAASANDYCAFPIIDIDPKVATGSSVGITVYFTYNGASDDVRLILYDETNDVILSDALDTFTVESNPTRYSSSAIVPTGVTQLRVGFQVVSATDTAALYIDDIELSTNPFIYKQLSNDTEWKTLDSSVGVFVKGTTTNPSYGTMVNNQARWRRDGAEMIIEWDFTQSTPGSPGSGIYLVDISETGYEIDLTKKPADTQEVFQNAFMSSSIGRMKLAYGVNSGSASVAEYEAIPYSSTEIKFAGAYTTVSGGSDAGYWGDNTHFYSFNLAYLMGSMQLRIPIVGWDSVTSEHVVTPAKNSATNQKIVNGITIEATTTDPVKASNLEVDKIEYRQEGDAGFFAYVYRTDSTVPTADAGLGDYLFSLPDGLSFDPDKTTFYTGSIGSTSTDDIAWRRQGKLEAVIDTVATVQAGGIIPYDSTRFRINYTDAGGLHRFINSGAFPTTAVNTGWRIEFKAYVNGWSSLGEFLAAVPTQKTAYIKHQVPNNTASGTFNSGSWQTRPLNVLSGDTDFISLSSNQFTLQPGVYNISASAATYYVNSHKLKLYNITDATDVIIGQNALSPDGPTFAIGTSAKLSGRFEIQKITTFELQHRSTKGQATNGFGFTSNIGVDEVYAEVEIEKVK